MDDRLSTAFFALLRTGLGLEDLNLAGWWPLTPDEWDGVYRIAVRHTVQGVVFDALQPLPDDEGRMPLELAAKWAMEVEENTRNWKKQAAVIKAQNATWAKNGLEGVVLKGHSSAALYPHPEHRICGDIDWWFGNAGAWEKANGIASTIVGEMTEDSDGDIHYCFNGVMIEHHRRWNDASSAKAKKELGQLCPDSPEGVLALLNFHILKHAMVFGIGLRQVCDLVMAYRRFDGKYDTQALDRILERCGLGRWTLLLKGLMVNVFGENALPCGVRPRTKISGRSVKRLFGLIMADGNFGKETGRGAGSLISTLKSRLFFFLRYAPLECLARLSGLTAGRIKRKRITI